MFKRYALLFFLCVATLCAETLPTEFSETLKNFRTEGPKGWAFTQFTATQKQSLLEKFDPSRPEMSRWTLVEKDGKAPSDEDLKEYREKQTRRTKGDNAPDVTDQLDLSTAEKLSEDTERTIYRFRLKSGGKDDTTSNYMRSTFVFHKPSRTIERIELASIEPFSPMLAVKIQEAQTVMNYTLPTSDRPSFLEKITVKVRGKAMFFKSLDEDLTVTYSDHKYVSKLPQPEKRPD